MSFAIFDQNFYLSSYPDVKAAVDAGAFSSGRQHFEQFGLAEGRVLVSPLYDEQLYLQKYSDVAAAVAAGAFKSGLQHYIQLGEAEGRSPGGFNEQAYLLFNPDVAAAVEAGAISSGIDHYIQYGQNENRIALFSGTSGSDVVTSPGEGIIIGVSFESVEPENGVGAVDTLIGGTGLNLFVFALEEISPTSSSAESLYVGGGSSDYAVIKNFEPGSDAIILSGASLADYSLQPVNGNLNISTSSGDLIATVEGVTSLSQIPDTAIDGSFALG